MVDPVIISTTQELDLKLSNLILELPNIIRNDGGEEDPGWLPSVVAKLDPS